MEADLSRMHRQRVLQDEGMVDKVVRYEAHLSRQLNQTWRLFEALKARRQGGVAALTRVNAQSLPEG